MKTQINTLGFKQNPKKSLDQNLIPKKSHAEFPSHKNFQRNYAVGVCGNYHESSDCFEYPNKSLLKSSYLNNNTILYLLKFSYPLEIRSDPPPRGERSPSSFVNCIKPITYGFDFTNNGKGSINISTF